MPPPHALATFPHGRVCCRSPTAPHHGLDVHACRNSAQVVCKAWTCPPVLLSPTSPHTLLADSSPLRSKKPPPRPSPLFHNQIHLTILSPKCQKKVGRGPTPSLPVRPMPPSSSLRLQTGRLSISPNQSFLFSIPAPTPPLLPLAIPSSRTITPGTPPPPRLQKRLQSSHVARNFPKQRGEERAGGRGGRDGQAAPARK